MTYKNKTITKHARGNWFVRIRYNGKYISIYGRTKVDVYEKLKVIADKAEQEKFLKLLGSLTTPQFVQKEIVPTASPAPTVKTYTLQEWFQEWLNSYKTGCVRASTINGFKVRFKRLKDFYDIKLTDITNLMLSKALNEITSCSARDAAHNLIKQMFSVAFTNHLIETNPAASLPRPKQVTVFEKKAFAQEQENKFIELSLADLETYEPLLITLLRINYVIYS